MKVKISVLMSVYNESEHILRSSISSILEQSYTDFEFIIINDNPKNNEINKVLMSVKDSRVKIINNPNNLGLVKSLNKGLEVASGEYIARMDADDIAVRDRLQKQLSYLEKNNCDIVGSSILCINEDGSITGAQETFPDDYHKIKRGII